MQRSVSGVAVAQECQDTFHALKTKNAHRFITFKIDAAAGQVQVSVILRAGLLGQSVSG